MVPYNAFGPRTSQVLLCPVYGCRCVRVCVWGGNWGDSRRGSEPLCHFTTICFSSPTAIFSTLLSSLQCSPHGQMQFLSEGLTPKSLTSSQKPSQLIYSSKPVICTLDPSALDMFLVLYGTFYMCISLCFEFFEGRDNTLLCL